MAKADVVRLRIGEEEKAAIAAIRAWLNRQLLDATDSSAIRYALLRFARDLPREKRKKG